LETILEQASLAIEDLKKELDEHKGEDKVSDGDNEDGDCEPLESSIRRADHETDEEKAGSTGTALALSSSLTMRQLLTDYLSWLVKRVLLRIGSISPKSSEVVETSWRHLP
jgi:hypothetical protein